MMPMAFVVCLVFAIAAALGVLLLKNIMHAALSLLACFLSIAALYILSQAEFLGVAQIMIYAGGILVLVIFGIMLTHKTSRPLEAGFQNVALATMGGLAFLSLLATAVWQADFGKPQLLPSDNIRQTGSAVTTTYAFAFEAGGILLLVSIVAAIYATHYKKG
jgi:NADH-quinone oxidoreductase subunit J